MENNESIDQSRIFSGNIFIFQAFDIGEDINLEKVRQSAPVLVRPLELSKYFKNYHTPLSIDLPHPHSSSKCISSHLHSFGVISLAYKIPFHDTLEQMRRKLINYDAEFLEQSVVDASSVFKAIKHLIKQPRFFHLRTYYVVIQVDSQPDLSVVDLKNSYGGTIASLLRFETEHLSEYQKNEILDDAIGYYRGDLFIVDTQAAFVYDEEYGEILDLFEFANIQQLELHYFDRMLDQQLNTVYQREVKALPFKTYLPFASAFLQNDPITLLGNLKVDISVIIERLTSSIKLAGEEYISEVYALLVEKMDLKNWKESIDDKLEIIKDINMVYQSKVDAIREDSLSLLIIILIFIELVVGILSYFK